MGNFEAFLCQVVSQVVDAIGQGTVKKSFSQFAFDLLELFHRHNFKSAMVKEDGLKQKQEMGRFIGKVLEAPRNFILN